MKTTGIVILNYNDSETTIKLLNKISNYKEINHIIVVDNCSSDDSYDILKSLKISRCEVIKSDKNGGYAYGNNIGAKYLNNKYNPDLILIANPDIEFEEDYIIEIVKQFNNFPEYSLLSGISIERNGKTSNSFWELPSYKESLLSCFFIYRIFRKILNKKEIDFEKKIIDVDVVQGSFFAIKSEVLDEIGYMDEGTFLFFEENILAKKLKNMGYKSGIITDLFYKHMHSVSIRKTIKSVQIYKIHLKSKMYFETNYRNLNKQKKQLLNIVMKYSIFEIIILSPFKNFIKKLVNSYSRARNS